MPVKTFFIYIQLPTLFQSPLSGLTKVFLKLQVHVHINKPVRIHTPIQISNHFQIKFLMKRHNTDTGRCDRYWQGCINVRLTSQNKTTLLAGFPDLVTG